MKTTTNYGLNKPEGTDYININDLNENADKIDTELKSHADSLAEVSTHLADMVQHPPYVGVSGGSSNVYTIALDPAPTSYVEGIGITLKIHVSNTGTSTLNINGLGAKSIVNSKGEAIEAGDLVANGVYTVRYNGVNFTLQGSGGGVSKSAQISSLSAVVGFSVAGKITLNWTNPADDKLKGVRIMYKTGSYPTSPTDGTVFYDSNDATPANTATKTGLVDGATYHIRAFAYTYKNATRIYTDTATGAQCTAIPKQTQGIQTFVSSGNFIVPYGVTAVDVFLVGGGGSSGYGRNNTYAGGGGGGYTKTVKNVQVSVGSSIPVIVGAGAPRSTFLPDGSFPINNGGESRFGDTIFASGGKGAPLAPGGGNGGSGGGGNNSSTNHHGGSDGSNGIGGTSPGLGQGTTTKAFGEASGTLYSGGGAGAMQGNPGAGGGGAPYTSGTANSGGGGGGGGPTSISGNGGSGIVIVRWGY